MMIKCHSCDQWFCEEHFEAADENDNRRQRITGVPTVKLVKTGLNDLAYYLGSCMACREKQAAKQAGRRPVDSTWLR